MGAKISVFRKRESKTEVFCSQMFFCAGSLAGIKRKTAETTKKSPAAQTSSQALGNIFVNAYPNKLHETVSPAITMDTIDISLIKMLRLGPDVSLNGSPTVSPTTAAR